MVCVMPPVQLPEDFVDDLNISDSGFIRGTSGPGVAAYVTRDQRRRADVYIGLKLDGVRGYENISVVRPDLTFRWVHRLTVSCWVDGADYDFDPGNNPLIVIKVLRSGAASYCAA